MHKFELFIESLLTHISANLAEMGEIRVRTQGRQCHAHSKGVN